MDMNDSIVLLNSTPYSNHHLGIASSKAHHTEEYITNNSSLRDVIFQKSAIESSCITYRLIFYFLIVGFVCIFGFIGNTISMFILKRVTQNRVASFLLQAIAVADNMVLGTTFMGMSIGYGLLPIALDDAAKIHTTAYIYKFIQPVAYTAHTMTIWLTVLIAVNRYNAICKPLQVRYLCTIKKARIQVALVFIVSIIYNFPRFFQYKLTLKKISLVGNQTVTVHMATQTCIGDNTLFGIVYTNAIYSIVVVILPLVFLILLNTKLIHEVRRMRLIRALLYTNQPIKGDNINKIMINIILVLIICHIPDRILMVVKLMVPHQQFGCLQAFSIVLGFVNLLVILSSSTNFLIYFMLSNNFRRRLKQSMCYKPSYQFPQSGFSFSHKDTSRTTIESIASELAGAANGGATEQHVRTTLLHLQL